MEYNIVKGGTGLRFCRFNARSGVGRRPNDEHDIFRQIWQSKKTDYYICPHCVYTVICDQYDILFKDIKMLRKIENKIYLKLIDGSQIEVSQRNFSINCCLSECIEPKEWVQEYKPTPKNGDYK